MAKEKEMNLLNVENTQDVSAHAQHDNKTESKGNNENVTQNIQKEYKSLETYKKLFKSTRKKDTRKVYVKSCV